jgi:lysophospholipase L1-like esterase
MFFGMNFKRLQSVLIAFSVVLLCVSPASAQKQWVGSWAASQQLVEPHNSLSNDDLQGATLRQIVHLSLGGTQIRVRLSNRFGAAPLRFTSVHVARAVAAGSAQIEVASDKALSFSGKPDVTIPAGADYVSDPVNFAVAPLSDLAISIHLDQPPTQQTGHPGSRATSYTEHGDFASAPDLHDAKKVEHWYFISGVDVLAAKNTSAIVILGDSITDGHGATTDANNRWPDVLARRLQAASGTKHLAVLNHGIGGNRILLDGIGPNAMARFNNDVVAQPGVEFLIVLEGINDLGMLTHDSEASPIEHEQLVHGLLAAYEQMITRAHEHGITVIGCTVTPFVGFSFYHPGPESEADRQAVNAWIRAPGHFDAVIDFDKILRDPDHPDHYLAKYDSGDHLHPSPEGYAAMGNAVPLALFSDRGQSRGKSFRSDGK